MVGITEDGAEHGKRDTVGEGCTQGNGRGLDGWEIWKVKVSKARDVYGGQSGSRSR